MTLNAYAAEKRLTLLEELKAGREPSEGEFDSAVLREARTKGQPQMGATRYEPYAIVCEFIYPDPLSTALVFTVRLTSPERIVFLPVPEWVVESIWQGEISGSFHFESDATRVVSDFVSSLDPDKNEKLFYQPRNPVGRA